MSPRAVGVYRCQHCGFASPKPGTCPDCRRSENAFHELVEERPAPRGPAATRRAGAPAGRPRPLRDVVLESRDRTRTGIAELDRVLGGGVVAGSLVLIGGDPGIGKCVTGDTRILDPESGAYLPLIRWRDRAARVLALDAASLRLSTAAVAAFHERGIHKIVELRTTLGRTLRCTPDHPVLTSDGWKPVGELESGDRLAAPRELACFGTIPLPEASIKLIAYALSDGSAQSQISITTELPDVVADLEQIAAAFDVTLVAYDKPRTRARQYRFCTSWQRRAMARDRFTATLWLVKKQLSISWEEWARRADVSKDLLNAWRRGECVPDIDSLGRLAAAAGRPITDFDPKSREGADKKTSVARYLEAVGVRFSRAADKAVPDCMFQLPRKETALFLRALFTCDGSVYVNRHGQPGVSYSTISKRLAEDVAHLLLRFGLVATVRTKRQRVNGKPYVAYELALLGVAEVQRFLGEIGIEGRQGAREKIATMEVRRGRSTRRDTVPTGPNFWKTVRRATEHTTLAAVSRDCGQRIMHRRTSRPLCRATVAALAAQVQDPWLVALGHGDVYWDTVASVVPAGVAPVYDLTVPSHSNFVANDLIVHNSTLILQAARALAEATPPVLYVSAEESAAQVKLRAERLGIATDGLLLWAENDLAAVQVQLDDVKPQALVIDSIQTVYLPDLDSAPGSVAQVRECGGRLMTVAKGRGIATFLVGHVTKEGTLAGPRVLEHLVDTVLYFEGEQHHAYRVLRAVKNRFGSTNEIGVFEMGPRGLVEVKNPSGFFLAERPHDAPGSVIVASLEGTRPLLLELQALVAPASFGTPRRTVLGADYNRVCLLLAVLDKRAGVPIASQDVFVNVAGGGRVVEPAADLAIVVAAASSYLDRPIRGGVVVIGEVGLTGEVRAVTGLEARLKEAAALGFTEAIVPASNLAGGAAPPLATSGVASVTAALDALLR